MNNNSGSNQTVEPGQGTNDMNKALHAMANPVTHFPQYAVEAETALGDINNARMILDTAAVPTGPFGHSMLMRRADYEAIQARLRAAVRKLEAPGA